jgi:squalene-associated FAD-dependent desaturase
VVVCGGGLAGIAAAVEAATRGAAVTLVERRPFLGGKAFSFADPGGGPDLDNGQHVFLGCCTAYLALLRRLGVIHQVALQPRMHVPVRDRAGRTGALTAAPLPAPLHSGPSFARFPHLGPRARARAAAALTHLAALGPRGRDALDDVSFADWLRAHGQDDDAIARFWDLIVLPTCNDRSDRVSAALAAFVFVEGLMRTRAGGAVGWSRVGLTQLVDGPARRALAAAGARVVCGQAVVAAGPDGVETSTGERIPADRVVLALPPGRVRAACPEALPEDPGLGSSPIVNVHLWLDRPVMEGPFVAVVDSPVQWVFNRNEVGGEPGPGQHLALSLSGAHDEMGVPRAALAARMAEEVRQVFPAARAATLLRTAVVKEAAATFAAAPGQAARRPGPVSPVPGVALAGTWTATGWPATMEGAVRSGLLAAHTVLC